MPHNADQRSYYGLRPVIVSSILSLYRSPRGLRLVYAHIANCECMYCTPSCTCTSHGPPHHKLSYIRASTK
jgi:hypothetical protein